MYRLEDYDLIIDARSEHEYAEDRINKLINLPVVSNDEYVEVGTLLRTDRIRVDLIGVVYSLKNILRHLETVIAAAILPVIAKCYISVITTCCEEFRTFQHRGDCWDDIREKNCAPVITGRG